MDKCCLCNKEFEMAHRFKGKYICDKCQDEFYDIYKIHIEVRETMRLSKIIQEALNKVIENNLK